MAPKPNGDEKFHFGEPSSVEISVYWAPADEAFVARCKETGVDRVIFMVDPVAEGEALAQSDALASLVEKCEG